MMKAILWIAVSSEAQASDEKESLPSQERDLRAIAERENWQVVDVLRIPGFSRDFWSWDEFMTEAEAAGIDAPRRMFDHWQRRDFDVVMLRDGSRFGRSQSLFSQFVEATIQAGSRIYSQRDGLVDAQNFRMFISMGSYASSTELDKLKAYRDSGMTGRAKRGLPTGSSVPISHILIRDPLGKALRLEVNEERRLLFDDLARVVCEGVGWVRIERALHERCGHERFAEKYFYKLLHNPMFWGHSARFHRMKSGSSAGRRVRRAKGDELGLWAFDLSIPPPEGVLFFPNTHTPVYTGDQAEHVMAELRRRQTVIKGRALPYKTHLATGLMVCGECGYTMAYYSEPDWPAYRCISRDPRYAGHRACSQRKYISEKKVIAYLDTLLRSLMTSQDISLLQPAPVDETPLLDSLRAELADAEGQARRLIALQLRAPDSLFDMYADELEEAGKRLGVLRGRIAALERRVISTEARGQSLELDDLIDLGLDAFWKLSHREINQHLHRLFAASRLAVRDGLIVAIHPA